MQLPHVIRLNRIRTTSNGYTANPMRLAGESATEVGGARDTYLLFITTSYISDPAVTERPAVNRGRIQLGHFFSRPIVSSHSLLTASFKLSEPLSASLPGSLAASVALGSARLDFEATPVVDADHGESESRSRRRRGRRCGLWKQHMGNGVAPEGICAACRARSIRRSQLVG